MTAAERIRARALATVLPISEADRLLLLAWFQAHPDAVDCYRNYAGDIVEGGAHRASMTSRTAQLVAILRDGFPRHWSRWAIEHRRGHP